MALIGLINNVTLSEAVQLPSVIVVRESAAPGPGPGPGPEPGPGPASPLTAGSFIKGISSSCSITCRSHSLCVCVCVCVCVG